MNISAWAALLGAYVAISLFLASLTHVAARSHSVRAMERHRVLGSRMRAVAAHGLPSAELLACAGAALLTLLATTDSPNLVVVLVSWAPATLLFAALAIYVYVAARRAPGEDCGCSGSASKPLSPSSIARPLLEGLAVSVAAFGVWVGEPISAKTALLAWILALGLMVAVTTVRRATQLPMAESYVAGD
jgi:amino acid transporter